MEITSYRLVKDFVYIKLTFDEKLVQDADLHEGWNERPVSKVSQGIGDKWIGEQGSTVLRVPSLIVPEGNNYLINFNHQDFKRIKIGDPILIQTSFDF